MPPRISMPPATPPIRAESHQPAAVRQLPLAASLPANPTDPPHLTPSSGDVQQHDRISQQHSQPADHSRTRHAFLAASPTILAREPQVVIFGDMSIRRNIYVERAHASRNPPSQRDAKERWVSGQIKLMFLPLLRREATAQNAQNR